MKRILFTLVPALFIVSFCYGQSTGNKKTAGKMKSETNTASSQNQQWAEGKDYTQYERVRLMDKVGFTEPQEAYSLLLPKGWKSDGNIIWVGPGNAGAGTYRYMIAKSEDGNYLFEMLPDVLYAWSNTPGAMQYTQNTNFSRTGPPMNAETYLRQVFVKELGGAQVVSVETNQAVIDHMRQSNSKAVTELMQYGAGQVNFDQTAVNAKIKWNDGSEALVTLGITIIATTVPNVYTGGSSQQFTTMVTKRTIFKYPAAKSQEATQLFSVIMSSLHTNPKWNDAVNNFWYQTRQQSHIAHVGRIKLMDEETRRIGEQTIRNGQQRLKNMEAQAQAHAQSQSRTWEQSQNSQDRMHTEFVKTIREVENFRDENGKWEMTAGYEHAWSRGDGTNFILSNDPNFNPASVYQDQNWKQMKKVH